MEKKLVQIREGSFTGNDGAEVSGVFLYLVPTQPGDGEPERIFLSQQRFGQLSVRPRLNDLLYVFRNDLGRVVDIVVYPPSQR